MKFTKLAAAIALASSAIAAPAMAEVELSATAGLVSDYVFRGVDLGDAAAYGSVDAAMGGFYAGIWTINTGADDASSRETDYYLGYGFEFDSGVGVDVSYVYYDYTGTQDNEKELALGLSYAGFGFSYVDGEGDWDSEDTDYTVTSVSYSGEVFGVTYGRSEEDDDGLEYDWAEVTASGEVSGLDVLLSLGTTRDSKEGGSEVADSNEGYLVLDVSKSFDL